MRSKMASALAAALMFAACASAAAQSYAPQVGRRHAEITLPRIDDPRPVSLSDFRGKKVFLIHFASW